MKELWKNVDGYDGKYEVSNKGRVRSLYSRHGKRSDPLILKPYKNKRNGYCYVRLYDNTGSSDVLRLHRIVAIAFIDNSEEKPDVNHLDCDKTNNCVDNLEWCTCQENMDHAWENGSYDSKLGSTNNLAKLEESEVLEIRELYSNGNFLQRELAEKYDVSISAINSIVNRRNWKHL